MEVVALPSDLPKRLDIVLAQHLSTSRSQAKYMIQNGHVFCNGLIIQSAAYNVKLTDMITYDPIMPIATTLRPINYPLNIVYEDDHLLVINKEAGMVVHPAPGNYENTLINALLPHCPLSDQGDPLRPGIVHRLDKDTSGLMVVAKTNEAHRCLAKQLEPAVNSSNFSDSTLADSKIKIMHRTYVGFVWGMPSSPQGQICSRIARHPLDRKKMKAFPVQYSRGKTAVSDYWTEKTWNKGSSKISLLKFRLLTGRTHQIRVHCQYMEMPLVGDLVYGKRLSKSEKEAFPCAANFQRQALHAQKIQFQHPVTQETMLFQADLPCDMKNLLKELDSCS